jgi:hypothetical protein
MIQRDTDGDALDEHAASFTELPAEQTGVHERLPPWATGWRRRMFVESIEELSEIIAGVRDHPGRPQLAREERFASVPHALATYAVWRIDGPGQGRGPGETLLQIARYQCRVQWSSKASVPAPLDMAEDIVCIDRAVRRAYETLPYMCPLLPKECEAALMYRYAGRRTPTEVAAIFAEPRLKDEKPIDVSPRQIGRITRHGHDRVYEYLRERGMVPHEERRKGFEMANPGGYDCEGWVQIADALGVKESTARDWLAADEQMPVRKILGRVYARKSELAKWWEQQGKKPGEVA